MKVGVENYWRFNGMKTPSMKARTKVLASFEAGMNSPNLPWHVNITLAYGNCARGTSGSQNRGVLEMFCEMHDALGSHFRLRFRMLQLKTPVFCGL